MTGQPRPELLLLDLDGVLRRWDPALIADAEALAGLPHGALANAVLRDPDLLGDAVTGVISDEEWRSEVVRRLARSWPAADVAVAAWSESAGAVDHTVLALVREVRTQVPVALFSNATSRLLRDLDALGLTEEVDAVVNSSDLGVAKPDPAAFLAAARACGRSPEACLFVDDSAANVAGARSVGMAAEQFTSVPKLREHLAALGLVDLQVSPRPGGAP